MNRRWTDLCGDVCRKVNLHIHLKKRRSFFTFLLLSTQDFACIRKVTELENGFGGISEKGGVPHYDKSIASEHRRQFCSA